MMCRISKTKIRFTNVNMKGSLLKLTRKVQNPVLDWNLSYSSETGHKRDQPEADRLLAPSGIFDL